MLVVDDFESWRTYVSSALRAMPRWQIVGEASDGANGVTQAAALRPDLILLDIAMPALNGIEAARRILDHNPDAKIIFISEHHAWDIAQEALATGARGYVIKSHAARELLPAMDALIGGGRFVSANLAGRGLQAMGDALVCAEPWHEVVFCSTDAQLLDAYLHMGHDALRAGVPFIVVAPEERRTAIRTGLEALGIDIDRETRQDRYFSFDVEAVLAHTLVDGWPDQSRFWEATTSLVMRAARSSPAGHPRVTACGECAPTLWRRGQGDSAVQLERLWTAFCRTFNIDVLCTYDSPTAYPDHDGAIFHGVCAAHTAVRTR